ncbi:MAG: isoaspartyl peptidase/L-asparaginase [Gammaproteobacteria bacterium]|jgi:beta-aspartyl-peptidase (threonine type)|nr:MAG: isoaspartyl peptidase/L-asparaginase [Gammaproteobacteria bacterium]
MRNLSAKLLAILLGLAPQIQVQADASEPVLLIHGGAGTLSRDEMTLERETEFRRGLMRALQKGYRVLDGGGTAVDAVSAAIVSMEDDPLFNAGRGAVFTGGGRNEMDAAIMDGETRAAGAVAGVRLVKNPILLAMAVMQDSPHVLLTGNGAEEFALARGIELRPPEYFRTEARWKQLMRRLESTAERAPTPDRVGTVGAVALDRHGRLAAGTSTGGMTGKRWGRVGDSPIIGAGTYAANPECAVSATGHGEYFIRAVVAYDICARVRYQGLEPEQAARQVILDDLVKMGGDGGVIVLGGDGEFSTIFNTNGMYRGVIDGPNRARVAIYLDETL